MLVTEDAKLKKILSPASTLVKILSTQMCVFFMCNIFLFIICSAGIYYLKQWLCRV